MAYTIYIATIAYGITKTYWISLFALYFQMIPKCIFVFFSLMTWMMSTMFHILASRIDELDVEKNKSTPPFSNTGEMFIYKEELAVLIRLHGHLCEITYQFSNNFGLIILIGTIYSFIGFISSSFRIVSKLKSENLQWIEVAFFLDYACLTILLIIIPNKLHQAVSKSSFYIHD